MKTRSRRSKYELTNGYRSHPWQAYQSTVRAGDYTIARGTWVGDYADPNTFLDMWVTNGGNNQTGFSSPVFDKLIAHAANLGPFLDAPDALLPSLAEPHKVRALVATARGASADARDAAWRALRLHLLREAEMILVQEELPILPIYFYVEGGLVSPGMKGFYSTLEFEDGSRAPNMQDEHPLRGMWMDRSSDQSVNGGLPQ